MKGSASLGAVTVAVLVLNLPFGFWRASLRRFSFPWFVAVHAPVPLVVGLRLLAGLGWTLGTFTLLASAFFAGQFIGAWSRRWRIQR